jgi:hypothetical protein
MREHTTVFRVGSTSWKIVVSSTYSVPVKLYRRQYRSDEWELHGDLADYLSGDVFHLTRSQLKNWALSQVRNIS